MSDSPVEHYQLALAFRDARGDPVRWARLAVNVAQVSASTRAVERPTEVLKGLRARRVPARMGGHTVGTRTGDPFECHAPDRGIEHLRAASTVFGRRSDSWAWIQCQQALGRAYMARATGDRAETLRLAERSSLSCARSLGSRDDG